MQNASTEAGTIIRTTTVKLKERPLPFSVLCALNTSPHYFPPRSVGGLATNQLAWPVASTLGHAEVQALPPLKSLISYCTFGPVGPECAYRSAWWRSHTLAGVKLLHCAGCGSVDGTMARWHDGTMARWHDGTMARWHDGTMARWHDGTMTPYNFSARCARCTLFSSCLRCHFTMSKGIPLHFAARNET